MRYLIISSSLNKQSKSRILARTAFAYFKTLNQVAEFVDLQDYDLPFCDGGPSYQQPQVKELEQKIRSADTLLLAGPVYNYGMNATLKNLYDLTTGAWKNKIVGLMLAGGGRSSYMAGMSFLNSLMINARCLIIPRFVFSLEDEVGEQTIKSEEVEKRVRELVETAVQMTQRLRSEP